MFYFPCDIEQFSFVDKLIVLNFRKFYRNMFVGIYVLLSFCIVSN